MKRRQEQLWLYIPKVFEKTKEIYADLKTVITSYETLHPNERTGKFMGKEVTIHRRQALYSTTPGEPYHYLGRFFIAEDISKCEVLLKLQQKAAELVKEDCGLVKKYCGLVKEDCIKNDIILPNFVFINLYEDGNHFISPHSDGDALDGSYIVSFSFGATRRFVIHDKLNKKDKSELSLHNGSCVLMRPGMQNSKFHSIPIEKRVKSARINVTFRFHSPQYIRKVTEWYERSQKSKT